MQGASSLTLELRCNYLKTHFRSDFLSTGSQWVNSQEHIRIVPFMRLLALLLPVDMQWHSVMALVALDSLAMLGQIKNIAIPDNAT